MLEGREIGARHELVDVRQRRHQPLRARLEARPTRARSEPDQPATRAPKRRHLARELRWIVALPALGPDDPPGSTANRASPPAAVELVQARADARPPAPVPHLPRHALERRVGIAHPQLARDAGQAGTEYEDLHRRSGARQGVREPQQEAAVPLHRARYVADQSNGAWPGAAVPPAPRNGLTARAQRAPKHEARGEPIAPAARPPTARWPQWQAGPPRREHRRRGPRPRPREV